MKNRLFPSIAAFCIWISATTFAGAAEPTTDFKNPADLAAAFENPPDWAKPSGYWWWLNANVDEEAITRDMEEFRDKGIGAVLLVSSGVWGGRLPVTGPEFLSDRWRELYKHALREADRVGIKVDVNIAPGWNMGGPWVTPDKACRWFLQSQTTVTGPQKFSGKLPLPGGKDGYDSPPQLGVRSYINLPLEEVDYRDTAVVAFRTPEGVEPGESPKARDDLPAKSNRVDANCFKPAADIMSQTLHPWEESTDDRPISVEDVVDLTDKLKPDGTLQWDVPEGSWTIVRTGHRMTGAKLSVPMPGQGGLENDYLDRAGVDLMFEKVGKVMIEDAGPLVGKSLRGFCSDSFECGYPNWTANMLKHFKRYRGYDPVPYLPVFRGWIVGNAEVSERFLYDYRKTVADCMADEHYGRFTELCREHGLKTRCESAGPSWSSTMCMDGLKNLGRVDFPQGEYWRFTYFVRDGQNMVCKQTSSAAHIYGKRTASAEACTASGGSFMHWGASPELLKPTVDRAFCEGINNCVFHTITCQRPQDGKPGYEYGAGTHFTPNVTWWEQGAGPWLSYINRCQVLLQSGLFVADVLYYNGDWAPNLVGPKRVDPSLGKGYDYDVCNAEVLLTRLSVKNGRIVLPDGMSYRVLALPDRKAMPVEVLAKIKQLVEDGATVVGPRPEKDPGLKNYPECDKQIKRMASELWGSCDGKTVTRNKVGKGQIVWGISLREVLTELGVTPDFKFAGESEDAQLDFIHRRTDEADIYFVINRNAHAVRANCSFRVPGKQPEFWDPVGGKIEDAQAFRQAASGTVVPMEFPPHGSMFVVFRKPTFRVEAGDMNNPFADLSTVQELTGPWQVQFDPEWGPAKPVTFDKLVSWTEHDDPLVKYFSGTATYKKTFDLAKGAANSGRLWLDLGQPKNLAAVRLNGKNLGVVWTSPFRIDITDAVKPKGNRLEIDVVNLWPNRLIGDAGLPPEKRLTNTNVGARQFRKGSPLLPSGLLGPVVLQTSE